MSLDLELVAYEYELDYTGRGNLGLALASFVQYNVIHDCFSWCQTGVEKERER